MFTPDLTGAKGSFARLFIVALAIGLFAISIAIRSRIHSGEIAESKSEPNMSIRDNIRGY